MRVAAETNINPNRSLNPLSETLTRVQIRAASDRERRLKNRKLMNDIKVARRCLYCRGIEDLQFHHRDPDQKFKKLADMETYAQERILNEIEKCDIVCKKCHRNLHRFGRIIVVPIPIYIPIPISIDPDALLA